MNNMNHKWKSVFLSIFVIIFFTAIITACEKTPAQKDAAEKEHFLTEKLETIKKAEAVNQIVQDAAALQRQRIDEESQ